MFWIKKGKHKSVTLEFILHLQNTETIFQLAIKAFIPSLDMEQA